MELTSHNPPRGKSIWRFCALFAVATYCIIFTIASLIEMRQLRFRGDLAAIWQSIYSLANWGEPFSTFNCSVHTYWSIAGTPRILEEQQSVIGCNQLGIHFHGLIYPLSLLARWYPHPELLVYVQSLVIGSAAWVLFILSERVLRSGSLAFGVLILFLVNPFVHGLHLNDFHFDAFMPLFIFLALYFLECQKFRALACLAVAGIFVKESFPLLVFTLGVLVVLWSRLSRARCCLGLGLSAFGLLSFLLLTKVVMPPLSFTGSYMFGGVYGSQLGASPSEIVLTCITKPWLFWGTLTSVPNQEYLWLLVSTTSAVALLSPEVLFVASPLLFINVVSSNPGMKVPWGQYNAAVIAACVAAIPFACRRLCQWGRWAGRLGGMVLVLSVAFNVYRSNERGLFRVPEVTSLTPRIPEILSLAQDSRVCVDDIFSIYASSRAEVYLTPVNLVRCDKVLWQKPDPDYLSGPTRALAREYLEKHFTTEFENERVRLYSRVLKPQ